MSLFPAKRHQPGFHAGDDLQAGAALRLDGVRMQAIETGRSRLVITALIFLMGFGAIGVRMVDVSLLDRAPARQAAAPQSRSDGLEMERADISDRSGVLLASSLPTVSLFAKPEDLKAAKVDVEGAAAQLVSVLSDLDMEDTIEKLASSRQFVYLKRNLTPRQQYDVNALGIPGLQFEKGERRIYPHGNLVSHVVGMTDVDNKGVAGIEKRFENAIRESREPLGLAIDIRVQTILRNELARAVQEFSAVGATGMVMDVNSGEMIAMVSLPDFDPNDPPPATDPAMFNRATKGAYEMGSTFKLFNTAMVLDLGRANLNSSFDASKPLVFASHTIHDDHALNRWLTIPEILIHSSNIGSARMALDAGTEAQRAFMARIGMLAPPAIELPEVGAPMVPNPWREISTITIAFGHGLSVTPLQLLSGVATLVNGGVYHQPTLLARSPDEKSAGIRIIKPKTSEQIRSLMRMVVTEGTGKKADVPGYEVGGKTGTAEKAGHGGYRKKAVLSSFVSAFPMDAPRYAVLIMIDEPQATKETYGFITAGWTAAPVTGRVIAQIAPLMGLMPKTVVPAPTVATKNVPPSGRSREVAAVE
ncbi:penicillin-binding protein [Paramagnetospirillum kuznetsovii]|uniref:Penicillin-binding protein n=1 Tax=Paramagnetospirillum kuznetsovii TaxID=2053833 RepID=A0A364P0S7_9PROT|nr:penicillin-binding protein 2 [Paramagnetospirillum kuznetsovii]RAU22906.1 penicillin-binding protein [Paramagnetospirillum kuznetsovii]